MFSSFHVNELQTYPIQPFPKRQILDFSKLKEFADNNFNFDENGRRFSKQIESTVGKGEIARYEQFLLFPQCFQKTCTADMQKPGLVWERVKSICRRHMMVNINSSFTLMIFKRLFSQGNKNLRTTGKDFNSRLSVNTSAHTFVSK